MIRVVIDTNIIVSALLQPLGPPAQVFLLAVSGSIQLCITGEVYAIRHEKSPRLGRRWPCRLTSSHTFIYIRNEYK
jgi:predicted nucleic acid-binding protein